MRRLLSPADDGKSGKVTVPKGWLEVDGVVDDEGKVERRQVNFEKKAPGRYEVVILDEQLDPLDERQPERQAEPAD